jgi:hypothetical protein
MVSVGRVCDTGEEGLLKATGPRVSPGVCGRVAAGAAPLVPSVPGRGGAAAPLSPPKPPVPPRPQPRVSPHHAVSTEVAGGSRVAAGSVREERGPWGPRTPVSSVKT